MGMLDMTTYTQLQAADALRDAAQNPSGGAGLTAGIGAGIGVGNVISQSLQGMTGAAAQNAASAQPAAAAATPSVRTPSEAATYLRVAEEDVDRGDPGWRSQGEEDRQRLPDQQRIIGRISERVTRKYHLNQRG